MACNLTQEQKDQYKAAYEVGFENGTPFIESVVIAFELDGECENVMFDYLFGELQLPLL